MPTINLEMMKKLLEEFSEKEALTTEEIKLIENEISSLDSRINICRDKLKNLSSDKEKLIAMKERYIKGNFSQYHQGTSAGTIEPSSIETNISRLPAAQPVSDNEKSLTSQTVTHASLSTSTSNKPVLENKKSTQVPLPETKSAIPKPVEAVVDLQETETDSQDQDNTSAKEGTEPIKSLNDALKGLFRK